MTYSEQDIQDALQKYRRGGSSIRKICLEFNIPRSTLQGRLRGGQPHKSAHQDSQILSPAQEQRMLEWVSLQIALRVAPTQEQIREFVIRMLDAQGTPRHVGKNWIKRFIGRHLVLQAHWTGKTGLGRPSGKRRRGRDVVEDEDSFTGFVTIEEIRRLQREAGRGEHGVAEDDEMETDHGDDGDAEGVEMGSSRIDDCEIEEGETATDDEDDKAAAEVEMEVDRAGDSAADESETESVDSAASCIVIA